MKVGTGILIATAILIVGCGGGGSNGNSVPSNATRITVAWPQRTRSVNAPTSALSCQFQFSTALNSLSLQISGNRPSGLGAQTDTYFGNKALLVGPCTLTGTFYSEPGEQGSVVGTVNTPVTIQSDGTLVGSNGQPVQLNFTGTIKTVTVPQNQSVGVGKTTTLVATAADAQGNPLIITPGSFSFALSSGAASLQLAANGNVKGLAVGEAQVTASTDGITSAPQLIVVGPTTATYDSFAITAAGVAYDAGRNLIYATCTPQSPTYAGLVSVIDPASNQFKTTLPTTNNPTFLDVSGDGKYVYVGGQNGTIQRVNLSTNTVDATIPMPTGTVPNQIEAIPGTSQSFAVSAAKASDGVTDEGTFILDGTTFRSTSAKIGLSIAVNSAGNRIYGYQVYQPTGAMYFSADLTPTGIANVQPHATNIVGVDSRIHWNQNKIISDSGTVVNPDTGSLIGQFHLSQGSPLAVPVAGTNVVYFLFSNPYEIDRYDLSTFTKNSAIQISGPTGAPNRALSLGGNRVGFHTTGGNPSAVYSVTGLP